VNENLPPTGRSRLRRLSAEEIELWLNVTKGVARRPGSRLPQAPKAAEDLPRDANLSRNQDNKPGISTPEPSAQAARRGAAPMPASPPPLAPLERRLRQKLARGRAAPEAAIDLHGMRRQEAFIALRQFLMQAQMEGARLVLVVTGKGERGTLGEGTPGILRQSVPNWLREPAYHAIVVGFEEAQRPHGGAGAFYVRLRRRDRPPRGNAP
jgi:DNA-nicking Smr family endonuclease